MLFTEENTIEVEAKYFSNRYPKDWRYGQTICNELNPPKEIEEKIFYEENTTLAMSIVWNYFEK